MIVYLHGLNSSSRSVKALRLKEALAPVPVLAPNYSPHRPARAVVELAEVVRQAAAKYGPPVLVGSSMGGFYGRWLATQMPCAHLFMINPAIRPWVQLRDQIGRPQCTASGERYTITREMLEQTRELAPSRPCSDLPVQTTLLLDYGDELIDQRVTATLYRACARILGFPDGDHGFAHLEQCLDLMRETLAHCR